MGPNARLVQVRKLTADDEGVLEAVRKADKQASDAHYDLQRLTRDVARTTQPENAKNMSDVNRPRPRLPVKGRLHVAWRELGLLRVRFPRLRLPKMRGTSAG